MRTRQVGSIALSLCLALCLALAGSWVMAASGVVQGRVTGQGGPLLSGASVRAMPLAGGNPVFAAIEEDGAYRLPELAEGIYQLDVVDANGEVLELARGPVEPVNVTASSVVLMQLAVTPAAQRDSKGAAAAAPSGKKKHRAAIAWSIAGGLTSAVLLVNWLNDDDEASPSRP